MVVIWSTSIISLRNVTAHSSRHRGFSSFSTEWRTLSGVNTRHLFRALLREASYLPDLSARQYIKSRIICRFRDNINTIPRFNDTSDHHQTSYNNGIKTLRQLSFANAGDWRTLNKCLAHTYARTGKRRRIILSQFSTPSAISNTAPTSEALLELEPNPKVAVSSLPAPLLSLLKSQVHVSPPSVYRHHLRKLPPETIDRTARLNAYLRPMPHCRVRNVLKKEKRRALECASVPLPNDEFESLREKSLGIGIKSAPRFRKRVGTHGDQIKDGMMAYSKRRIKLADETFWDRAVRPISVDIQRKMNERFLMLRYRSVFVECCRIVEGQKEMKFEWGHNVMKDLARKGTIKDA